MGMLRSAVLTFCAGALFAASIGPSHGSLIIVGGGQLTPEIIQKFIDLAGGKDAPMVFVPTAEDGEPRITASNTFLAKAGCKNVTILHNRDRAGAESGNTVMMSPGHETGMAFLRNSAVDQHVITRHRENDLDQVIDRYPKLLGIGIDE